MTAVGARKGRNDDREALTAEYQLQLTLRASISNPWLLEFMKPGASFSISPWVSLT